PQAGGITWFEPMTSKRRDKSRRDAAKSAKARPAAKRPSRARRATPAEARPLPPPPQAVRKNVFPVVGIGASAGGLEALEQFLKHTPSDSGMAFVIVQHLDPTHKGMLVELLQRWTKMPVEQASDGEEVVPDHVYVIHPNKDM